MPMKSYISVYFVLLSIYKILLLHGLTVNADIQALLHIPPNFDVRRLLLTSSSTKTVCLFRNPLSG